MTNFQMENRKNHDSEDVKAKLQSKENEEKNSVSNLADIIGEFNFFQLVITILAFIRYVCLALMTNSGSLIAPNVEHWCQIPEELKALVKKPNNVTIDDFLKNKCELNLSNGNQFVCSKWSYNTNKTGITLTDSFDLVCDRDSLRSTFQSVISAGVLAAVIWGSISDRHGRNLTIRICFIWSFVFGLLSYFANSFLLYTISRTMCSFSDTGLVLSLTTIVVETLGNKYRGAVCVIIYTGWSIGVMIVPWLNEYFFNFKQLMLFTVALHIATLPFIIKSVGESIRWLLVNGYFSEAKQELNRICIINGECDDLDTKFEQLKKRFVRIAAKRKYIRENVESKWSKPKLYFLTLVGGFTKVNQLFSSKELTIATLTMAFITFNGELFYMITTQINSDIGDSLKLNYAIGGLMEMIASVLAILMISYMSRKLSLAFTLLPISALCFTLAKTHHMATLSIWVLNITKLAVSTLTSIVYVIITELYPTDLRQTGIGFTCLLGGVGAIVGPYVRTELVNFIGLTWVLYILAIIPLVAAFIDMLFLRETKGVELKDDLDELEEEGEILQDS